MLLVATDRSRAVGLDGDPCSDVVFTGNVHRKQSSMGPALNLCVVRLN